MDRSEVGGHPVPTLVRAWETTPYVHAETGWAVCLVLHFIGIRIVSGAAFQERWEGVDRQDDWAHGLGSLHFPR